MSDIKLANGPKASIVVPGQVGQVETSQPGGYCSVACLLACVSCVQCCLCGSRRVSMIGAVAATRKDYAVTYKRDERIRRKYLPPTSPTAKVTPLPPGVTMALEAPENADLKKALDELWLAAHVRNSVRAYKVVVRLRGIAPKLAQLFSTRTDVFPLQWLDRMKQCQQDMPMLASHSETMQVIKESFGKPVKEIFAEFAEKPVGVASIAQVHRARLKDGREVAVKVQHRGVEKQMLHDLETTKTIIRMLTRKYPQVDLSQFVNAWADAVPQEFKFDTEASNLRELAGVFDKAKAEKDDSIRCKTAVPGVIEGYLSKRVLMMEWMDGISLNNTATLDLLLFDRNALVKDVIRSLAYQLFVAGVFQADPHPGNWLLLVKDIPDDCLLRVGTRVRRIFKLPPVPKDDEPAAAAPAEAADDLDGEVVSVGDKGQFTVRSDKAGALTVCTWRDVEPKFKGQLCLLDMGLVGRFDEKLRRALGMILLAGHELRLDRLEMAFAELGIDPTRKDDDRTPEQRREQRMDFAKKIFNASESLDRNVIHHGWMNSGGSKDQDESMKRIGGRFSNLPGELIFFQRSLKMVQGLASLLEVTVDFKSVMAPCVYKLLGEEAPKSDCSIM